MYIALVKKNTTGWMLSNARMKIVMVTHYFHPHTGGIETVAGQHARILSKRGHDVTVVSSRLNDEPRHECRKGYLIKRYSANNIAESYGIPYPLPNILSAVNVLKSAYTHDTDVIHVHGFNYLSTAIALTVAPDNVPAVLHQHTPFINYGRGINKIEHINDRSIGKYNLSQADRVLAASEKIRAYAESILPDIDAYVFHNAVDTTKFSPPSIRETSKEPLFFVLSRLVYKKGIRTILKAAEQLSEQGSDAEFIIAGTGPDEEQIASEATSLPNIEIEGYIPEKKISSFYRAARAFVFASQSGEAFPTMSVLESFASGTPVIATRIDEKMEGLQHGENGLLIEPGNPTELVQAVTDLETDPKRAQRMGKRARTNMVEAFNIERRVTELKSHYRAVQRDEAGEQR